MPKIPVLFLLVTTWTIPECFSAETSPPFNPCNNYCCPQHEYCSPRPFCPRNVKPCLPFPDCSNPCKNYSCPAGTRCVVKPNPTGGYYNPWRAVCQSLCHDYPCPTAQNCTTTPNERGKIVPICLGLCSRVRCDGTCVDEVDECGFDRPHCYPPEPRKPSPCFGYTCPEKQTCVLVAQYCPKPPCEPRAQCVESNPCRTQLCPYGQYCYVRPLFCIRAPCPPAAACLDPCAGSECGPGTTCVQKFYSDGYPPYAVCEDPCVGEKCPITKKCVCTVDGKTKCVGPCDRDPGVGRCVERIGRDGKAYALRCSPPRKPNPCAGCRCVGDQTCVVTTTVSNSTLVQCTVNVCKGYSCPDGQYCYPKQVICVRAPCNPVPECRNPCDGFMCAGGKKCVVKKNECPPGYCPPEARCE